MSELHRMQREQEDAEVVVSLDCLKKEATICVSDWPAQARKFEKLFGEPTRITKQAARYSEDGTIQHRNRVRSAIWKVPLAAIRINRRRIGPKTFPKKKEVAVEPLAGQEMAS